MKVSIELFKGKKLANNENPIVIRIFNNGAYTHKSIGISTLEKYWNKTKKRITCRDKHYKIKNEIIKKEYERINERIYYFQKNNEDIDVKYILGNDVIEDYGLEKEQFDKHNFIEIMKNKLNCYGNPKTKENYLTFYNLFKSIYGEYIDVRNINQLFVNDLINKLNEKYGKETMNNQKNHALSFFKVSYIHGVNNKWINTPINFEIKKFNYKINEERYIDYEMVTNIIRYYKKRIQGGNIDYKKNKALFIFILDLAFQGLAPVDLANIKVGMIKFKVIYEIDVNLAKYNNNSEYKKYIDENQRKRRVIKIDLFRQKNGNSVSICTDYSVIAPIIDYLIKDKTDEDYLIDCYDKQRERTHKQLSNRRGAYFTKLSDDFNRDFDSFCESEGLNYKNRMTFYYARHGFCNAVDKLEIDRNLIRKMVGHSFKTLEESYLNKPTDWEQSTVIKKLFDSEGTKETTVDYIYSYGIEKDIKERWKEINELKNVNK